MGLSEKIRILLADDDALRRDGLEAVLSANQQFEVVAVARNGETALTEIRGRQPHVAVVDLNLPLIHAIELVRRVRAEAISTKIIVYSGTDDDEIVREVIRAGGDGYVLKNGPARHLADAIVYVCDGGQYFSPQLGRDGTKRHLLEEPARTAWLHEPAAEGEPDELLAGRSSRSARARRPRRPLRPVNDSLNLRQRIREDTASSSLNDHDYEIMTRMADGIRPILDRLDEIDTRVARMEVGAEPVPPDPRRWLNNQLEDSLSGDRSDKGLSFARRENMGTLEARLPELIEEAVTRRFQQVSGKLQQEIEETHVRTLETFVRNIQVKLVQRISALESDMSKHTEAMSQLQQDSLRTEDNLSRLINGVDKLAQELPRRLAATSSGTPPTAPPDAEANAAPPKPRKRLDNRHDRIVKIIWAAVPAVILLGVLAWAAFTLERPGSDPNNSEPARTASAPNKAKPAPSAAADTKTRMQAAQECVDRKDYAVAEDLYKQIVRSEPSNVEALRSLASVLYREDKIEESAEILDKLSKN